MSGSRKTKLEGVTEKDFVRYAQSYGCVCIKGELFGSSHWPDQLVLCPNDHYFWIEFKREGEEPRPGQLIKHNHLRDANHTVIWTDRYEEATGLLDEILCLSKTSSQTVTSWLEHHALVKTRKR